MSLLDTLLGRNAQINEQPITFTPLQTVQNNAPTLPLVQIPMPEQSMVSTGLTAIPEKTGILDDLINGYKDNAYNSFKTSNLRPDTNKSIANKIGEGFGTAARFLNSPTGRGLAMAGLVGATGGNGLQALAYGAQTGATNQKIKNEDKFYRQALKNEGVETSNISGYLNSDMYKNYSLGKYRTGSLAIREQLGLLKDNTSRAKAILQGFNNGFINKDEAIRLANQYGISLNTLENSNQTRNADINEYLAPSKKKMYEASPQIALGRLQEQIRQNDIGNSIRKEEMRNKNPYTKQIQANQSTLSNIDKGLDLIRQNPNAYTYIKGKLPADITNRLDAKGVATRTQIDNITAIYRKWLTGAQMSDRERKDYERFLPAPSDNANIIEDKLINMRDAIQRQTDIYKVKVHQENDFQEYDDTSFQTQKTPQQLAIEELKKRGRL